MLRRYGLTTLSLVLCLALPARAATYYVSQSGSDSNSCATAQGTTQSNQKRTISAGVACLSPGDTLSIHGGIYTGSSNVIDSATAVVRSGTSWSNAITIAGYPSETVTIRPSTNTHGIRLTTGAPAYLIFRDFIIDMVNETSGLEGIYLSNGAHHNRFERLEVKNSKGFGIVFSRNNGNSPFNEVIHCLVHSNGTPGGPPTDGHGLYISTSDNLFHGNEVHSNQGYGFHMYDNEGPKFVARNVLRNNRIYNNGLHPSGGSAIVIAWGADNLIYNNLIFDNPGGIQIYTESQGTKVYNNTIYSNDGAGIVAQYYATAPTIRNNIVYSNQSGIVDHGGTSGPIIQDHNLTSDPMFMNAGARDFHLQPGSPAVDAGTSISSVPSDYDGTARPQGGAYDLGAFERGGQPPSTPKDVRLTNP